MKTGNEQTNAVNFLEATLPLVGFLSRRVTKFLGLNRNLSMFKG